MSIKKLYKEALRNKMFMVGLVLFLLIVIIAVFAGSIAPHSYKETDVTKALLAPSSEFPFGTDQSVAVYLAG